MGKDEEFNLSDHKDEDEFWLILDVDKNTDKTPNRTGKSRYLQWMEVLSKCKDYGYGCAISNPFFELWLLLHFDDVCEEDYNYAVTDAHPYESTNHFKDRLEKANVPLIGRHRKNIGDNEIKKYNKENIIVAMKRAKELDIPPCDDYPQTLGTTVYKLIESIAEVDKQFANNT